MAVPAPEVSVGELVQQVYDKTLQFHGFGRWPPSVPLNARLYSIRYDELSHSTSISFSWEEIRDFGRSFVTKGYSMPVIGRVGPVEVERWRQCFREGLPTVPRQIEAPGGPRQPQMVVCADCGMDTFDDIVDARTGLDLCFYCKELRDLRARHPVPKKQWWWRRRG